MNQTAYQRSNLIDLMNAIVQDRRGEIFSRDEGRQTVGNTTGFDSKVSANLNDTGYVEPSMRRTGLLRKSIMSSN
jgi:hypothetical protein